MKKGPLALAIVGLWVILQSTYGPLATKLGLIAGAASSSSSSSSNSGGTPPPQGPSTPGKVTPPRVPNGIG